MSEAPTVGRFVLKHCSGSRDARETKPLRHFLFLKRERKMGILEISRLFELSAPHVNQLTEDSEGVNWQRPGTRIHSNDQMRPYCKSTLNSFSLTIISSCTLAHFQLPFNLSAVITGWPNVSLCRRTEEHSQLSNVKSVWFHSVEPRGGWSCDPHAAGEVFERSRVSRHRKVELLSPFREKRRQQLEIKLWWSYRW